LEGVPIAYSDERVLSTVAIVHPYFPLTRLAVSATLVCFRPHPGARVLGVVNKVTEGYIGLVVLGFMNAVIRAQDVRPDLKPRLLGSEWSSAKNPAHVIRVGDTVAFTVAIVEHSGPYVTLIGALTAADTGNVAIVGVEPVPAEEPHKGGKTRDKAKGKKKEKGGEHEGNGNGVAAATEAEKERKRKRREDDAGDDGKEKKKSKERKKEKKGLKEKERRKKGSNGE